MQLTAECVHALRAVAFLAGREGNRPVASRDIARAAGITQGYGLKVLGPLADAGLLRSRKGPGGGYRLARPAADITLLEVVEAMDGPLRGEAPGVTGAVNDKLKAVCQRTAERARELLAGVSVADLAKAVGGA
jgi:Rrf2 family protein